MDQSLPPLACKGFKGSSDGANPTPLVMNTRSRRSDGPLVVPLREMLLLPLFMRCKWSGLSQSKVVSC